MTVGPTIWVVVPLSRPECLTNVWANFHRQRYPSKELVIVENGAAVGACRRANIMPDVLLDSEPHQSAAKNMALRYLQERGATHWATNDDDDYYGPGYLEGIADGFARGFEVVGKSSIFLRYSNGRMHFLEQEGEQRQVGLVNGPTISSVVRPDMPMFPMMEWGEDNAWLEQAHALGWRNWAANRYDFCWCRHPRPHTYPMADEALENLSRALGPVFDCGVFDYHVVNGVERSERFDKLPEQELDMRHHPALRHWEQQGIDIPWRTFNTFKPPNT